MLLGRPLTAAQSPPGPPVRELVRNLLGVEAGDAAKPMYDLASPIHHVSSSCPPTLLFQGTHDAVVPLEAARRLHRSLETAGVPVVYVEYVRIEHAFELVYPPLANPAARAALYDLERFLVLAAGPAATASSTDPSCAGEPLRAPRS